MGSIKWLQTDEVSEQARMMLAAFEEAFSIGNTGYTVTHLRVDAVFVMVGGWCNPYQVTKFVTNNTRIYCEITARSRNYYEFRMFCSDYLIQHEMPRMMAIANMLYTGHPAPRSVRIQARAWKELKGEVKHDE